MFATCVNSIKILFIVPTDAHYYKIVEMLKRLKLTFAPTCFGSRRKHHQGAVLCLAKTTSVVFLLCSTIQKCGSRRRKEMSSFLHREPHTRTTVWHAAITLTKSIRTSTKKPHLQFQLNTGLLPDDGSCVNRNMSEQMSQF